MPTIYKPKKNKPKDNNQYDADRRKIYNSERWRRLRAWKFLCNPLCELCLKEGPPRTSTTLSHS
jgi:5-methylcytosine-specific restriction protein A